MSPDVWRSGRFDTAVRQIFLIAAGLWIEVAREALVPGLAPLIALTLAAAPGKPPGPGKMLGVVAVFSAAALGVLVITSAALSVPGLYPIAVAVLFLWAFFLCFDARMAAIGQVLLMMTVSVSALTAGSNLLATVIVWDMVSSIAIAAALVLLAFAIAPRQLEEAEGQNDEEDAPYGKASRAILATIIILPLHLYLTSEGLAPIVVILTAATMLTLANWGRFKAYGAVFAGGNLIGGLFAVLAAVVTASQSASAVLLSTAAACAAVIAYLGQRPGPLSNLASPAAAAFTLLFGMVLSPLATGADVDVVTRVLQILVAVAYVLGATSLAVAGMEFQRARRNGIGESVTDRV